jgi:hypothetical protein
MSLPMVAVLCFQFAVMHAVLMVAWLRHERSRYETAQPTQAGGIKSL